MKEFLGRIGFVFLALIGVAFIILLLLISAIYWIFTGRDLMNTLVNLKHKGNESTLLHKKQRDDGM